MKKEPAAAPAVTKAQQAGALFAQGVAAHQEGRLDQAIALYRQAIDLHPAFPEAFNNLGLARLAQGLGDQAVEAFRQAIALRPGFVEALNNLGSTYFRHKAFAEAAEIYRQTVAARPDFPEAHFNLGNAVAAGGQAGEAMGHYRRALALRPDFPEAYNAVGALLRQQGLLDEAARFCLEVTKLQPDNLGIHLLLAGILRDRASHAEAETLCRRALEIDPNSATAWNDLGVTLLERQMLEAATEALRRAISLNPDSAYYHNNLAAALRQRGETAEALEESGRAIALQPDFPEACNNLGNGLREANRFDEAVAAYERAITLKPDYALAYANLGNVLRDLGRLADSRAAYEQALALQPDDAQSRVNYAMALLQDGRFTEGWEEYEARWRTGRNGDRPALEGRPEWSGDDPAGRRILLYAEQGHGDVLQFCRFAPLVAARGARVVLAAYRPLLRLLRTLPGSPEVVDSGAPLPAFDLHLPLMSLPRLLGTRPDSIPAAIPYLAADPADSERWRRRLGELPGLKVGLVWAGDSRQHDPGAHLVDRRRSMRLAQFAPLAGLPVSFVSLQKGAPAAQLAEPPAGLSLLDAMEEVSDFADTAALMEALDLVVSVDTSVVHLAGALGKPVWILSRYDACWRWLGQDRADTPWYPTARLFRQPRPGDWEPVVRQLRTALEQRIAEA